MIKNIKHKISMIESIHEDYLRSIVFGFQDALVSTTGAIAGVAAGSQDRSLVILVGIVVITVESMSMGIGQYLSEKTVHQHVRSGEHTDNLYIGAGLMTLSYFLGGLVPLAPIILFPLPLSAALSIGFALIGLFILGYIKAHIVNVPAFRSAIEIFILGGIVTIIGVIVGRLLQV